ncbi:hypothetical protein IWX48DRAFT_600683 [Phyllosticta citricarpa]
MARSANIVFFFPFSNAMSTIAVLIIPSLCKEMRSAVPCFLVPDFPFCIHSHEGGVSQPHKKVFHSVPSICATDVNLVGSFTDNVSTNDGFNRSDVVPVDFRRNLARVVFVGRTWARTRTGA